MAMTLHHPAATTAAEARRDMDACCACACTARRRSCCCCFRLRKLRGAALGLAVCLLYCLAMRDVATLLGGPRATTAPCSAPAARESSQPQSLIQSRDPDRRRHWMSLDGPPLPEEEESIALLLAQWEKSSFLRLPHGHPQRRKMSQDATTAAAAVGRIAPPHLEDCEHQAKVYHKLDSRGRNGRRPAWSLWKAQLGDVPRLGAAAGHELELDDGEHLVGNSTGLRWGPFPPWIDGSDQDNLPFTRRVQRDVWLLQHPRNCSAPGVRFLLADWQNRNSLGLGAEINRMAGMLGLAVTQRRVLVFGDFNRADHKACRGKHRKRWSCYFSPETTDECRQRAQLLAADHQALADQTVLLGLNIRRSHHDVWKSMPPDLWGTPWTQAQPTTEVGGKLLVKHRCMYLRWWRAQAIRYFMRFPTCYTCMLLNRARHDAFGVRAATIVLRSVLQLGEQQGLAKEADMEKWVWKSHKPWIPRPLLSVHVRQGDKAKEMRMVGFEAYMDLANRLRARFPHVHDIWLSTEMQSVITAASQSYPAWNFHYTRVPRQSDNMSMVDYEASMGLETSTTNAFVNFLMAADADFFVGALGSSWCYLIDAMRSTGGKVMAGYLSVNKDRHWK